MRPIILSVLIILIPFLSNSQTVEEEYSSGGLYEDQEFALGLSGLYLEYPDLATRTGYGLSLDYCVHKNVSLNWHLFFGRRYFSTSLWVPIGPLLFAASLSTGNISRETLALLLLSALPDGISFPIRISDKVFITPSIAPLNLDMMGFDPPLKRYYVNGNITLGVHIKGKYFNIHPYGGLNLLYKKAPNFGYSGGLEIELRLKSLKK